MDHREYLEGKNFSLVLGGPFFQLLNRGDKLLDFKIEIIVVVVLVLCLVILPLFSFSSQLAEAKRTGSMEYGKFASEYVQGFETKWVKKTTPADVSLMGADIQSLADLGNTYNREYARAAHHPKRRDFVSCSYRCSSVAASADHDASG